MHSVYTCTVYATVYTYTVENLNVVLDTTSKQYYNSFDYVNPTLRHIQIPKLIPSITIYRIMK